KTGVEFIHGWISFLASKPAEFGWVAGAGVFGSLGFAAAGASEDSSPRHPSLTTPLVSTLTLRRLLSSRRFRRPPRIAQFAGHGLLLDGDDLGLLVLLEGHFLVLGALENDVESLALDHLGGQRFHHVFFFQPSADAARRIALLLGHALDFVLDVVFV